MSRRIALDLNRVEGDLRVELDVDSGRVRSARCIGTLFRGFEQILLGRDPLDALAITPRICGICSTTHLMAAVHAIENASGIVPAPAALHVRNLCLMAETVQSDLRHAFVYAAPDFCDSYWATLPDAEAAVAAFSPLSGVAIREVVEYTRRILQIVAHFGGQWPHSSYMVPGGVTLFDCVRQLQAARARQQEVQAWFDRAVLGDSLDSFLAIEDADGLTRWRDDAARRDCWLPLYDRLMVSAGLDTLGRSHSVLLTYGSLPDAASGGLRYAAGCIDLRTGERHDPDMAAITEDISHSWYFDPEAQPRHPSRGITQPAWSQGGQPYSWAKAPRYRGQPAQVGALSLLACSGDALMLSLLAESGDSARVRAFARMRRAAMYLRDMRIELDGLQAALHGGGDAASLINHGMVTSEGQGVGLVDAARGGLGHWLSIRNGRIEGYQVITPTAWNASPRDAAFRCGAIELALEGLPCVEGARPLLVEQVIRSFDPCLVCTVH